MVPRPLVGTPATIALVKGFSSEKRNYYHDMLVCANTFPTLFYSSLQETTRFGNIALEKKDREAEDYGKTNENEVCGCCHQQVALARCPFWCAEQMIVVKRVGAI